MCENQSTKATSHNVSGSLLSEILPDECESKFIHPVTLFTLWQNSVYY